MIILIILALVIIYCIITYNSLVSIKNNVAKLGPILMCY